MLQKDLTKYAAVKYLYRVEKFTLARIGLVFGISRQRVEQILKTRIKKEGRVKE